MRILQLVKWLSPREDTGGKIRSFQLGRILSSFACVDVAGFVRPGAPVSGREEHLTHYHELFPIPFRPEVRSCLGFASWSAGEISLRSARFSASVYRRTVDKILSEDHYDAVQVEELPLMNNLGPLPQNLPVVYSAHNVESRLSFSIFTRRSPLSRFIAEMERRRTLVEERRAVERSRACLAVSDTDRDSLLRLCPSGVAVHVLPNCAHERFRPSVAPVSAKEILCAGAFGWHANRDGLTWFIEAVLPRLRETCAGLTVRVAGSEIGPSLSRRLRRCGVLVHPDVPDVLPFLQAARLLLVPLRVGGGTRIKIVEAWAAGTPVVSTRAGAEGLPCRPGVDIVIADEPIQLAEAICEVLDDDLFYGMLRSEGLNRAERLRWSGLASALKGIYASLLENGRELLGNSCECPAHMERTKG